MDRPRPCAPRPLPGRDNRLGLTAPKAVKEGVNKTEAAEIKKKLEDVGAKVELK